MKRNLRWSIRDSSQASLTRAVELLGAPSTIDMNPIASFGPQISTTLSPITISITPDCTMYMQLPGSPLLKIKLPALNVTFAPALCANMRASIGQQVYDKNAWARASFALTNGAIILGSRARPPPGTPIGGHCGGDDHG